MCVYIQVNYLPSHETHRLKAAERYESPAGTFWVITIDVKCLRYSSTGKTDAVMAVDAHTSPLTIYHHIRVSFVYGGIIRVCKEAEGQMEA